MVNDLEYKTAFRVGGKENFFHCMKCNICLAINIKESHKVFFRFFSWYFFKILAMNAIYLSKGTRNTRVVWF